MPSDMLREVWLGLKRFWALGGIIKVPILAAIAFLAVAIIAGAVGGDDEGDHSTNVASDWTPTTSLSSLSSLSPSQLIERFKITPLALPTFGPRDLSRFWLTTATPSASQAGGQSQPTTEAPASPESVPSTEASAPLVPQAETPSPASPTQPPPQSPSLAELQPVPQQGYDECLQECEDSFFACVDNEDRCELERSQCQHDAEWVCGEAESSCQDDCDQDEDACVAACDLAASTCRRDCEASWDALFYFCLDMCTDEFEMVDVDCHDECMVQQEDIDCEDDCRYDRSSCGDTCVDEHYDCEDDCEDYSTCVQEKTALCEESLQGCEPGTEGNCYGERGTCENGC